MIDTVIFDLYGTLADIHTDEESPLLWDKLAMFYRQHGADYSPEELEWEYETLVNSAKEGLRALRQDAHEGHLEIDIAQVFQYLFLRKGVPADDALVAQAAQFFRILSTDYLRLYPYASQILENLKYAGKKVILLSNAQSLFTRPELKALGIDDLFDHIYISSEYETCKPDPRFFEICLQEQNINPETAIMVGNDGICDIQGARECGLKTLYIHSNISPKDDKADADYALESMDLKKAEEIILNI